jgi:hypothetical protein
MKLAISSAFALVLAAGAAHAGPEPWCGQGVAGNFSVSMGNKFTYNSDADDLADSMALMNVVGASCDTLGHENDQFRTQLAAARARWAKRLHMTDADWADAAQWVAQPQSMLFDRPISRPAHQAYSEMSPLGQFGVLSYVEVDGPANTAYLADAFGSHLTQTGLAGYARACLAHSSATDWALCLSDAESIDLDKLSAELRTDATASGPDRMFVRYAAWDLVTNLVPKRRAELAKKDPAYAKLAEIATRGRQSFHANADSLALVGSLDDAIAKNSRSLHVAGCDAKARTALTAAVAALPASTFADMPMLPPKPDPAVKDKPAFVAAPRKLLEALAATPDGYLAEVAVVLCAIDSAQPNDLALELTKIVPFKPGFRGPRTAALSAMRDSGLEPDARDQKISYPATRHSWQINDNHQHVFSKGMIAKVSRKGDTVHIEYSGKNVTEQFCDDWANTNHVTGIRDDGAITYERECSSKKTTTFNTAPKPIDLDAADGAALKPGMTLLVTNGVTIAWKKTGDKKPAVALGAAVK